MKESLIFVIFAAVGFATFEPVSSLPAMGGTDPFTVTAIRFLIGSLVLLPFSVAAVRRRGLRISKRDWLVLSALGVLVICVSMNLLQLSVQIARDNGGVPANIAIIFSSNSLITILLSSLLLRERLTRHKLLAAGLGFFGLFFCVNLREQDGLLSSLTALLAAATFSLYTVLSKRNTAHLGGIVQLGFSFLIGTIVLVAILLCAGLDLQRSVTLRNWPHILYLGLVTTGLAYVAFVYSIARWSTMAASLVFFFKPVFTPFLFWIINGIRPGRNIFIAALFVLAGSVVSVLEPKRNAAESALDPRRGREG